MTWSAVTGATSYNVYRSLTPGGAYGSPLASGLTAATYTDNAVSNGTTYYYVATAVDGTGEGPLSSEDSATPRAGTFVSGVIGSSSGPITTTWTLAGSPYVVVGDVEVRGNASTSGDRTSTLVIQAGVAVLFEPGTGLFVGDDTGIVAGHMGRLQATGATFTSNRSAPAAGDWKGILFGDTATDGGTNNFLDGCTVDWAGGGGAAAAVVVNLSAPELRNGTAIRGTASGGVYVTGSVTLSGGEIEGGSGPAVRLLGASSISLTGVTLRGGTYPVQIQPNVVLSALSGNTATGYASERSGIAVEGGLMGNSSGPQDRTWPGGDLPYIVLADLEVRGNQDTSGNRTSTLTIGAGQPAEVRFNSGAGLTIGQDSGQHPGFAGRLLATGVTFKGNTTTPSAGFWDGIYFADTATEGGLTLDGCLVEGAGGAGTNGAVAVNLTTVVLRNGTAIRLTGNVGLRLSSNDFTVATVTGGEIEGGSGPAIQALGRSTLSLTGVTLRGGTYPVRIQPNVTLQALSGNTATGYPLERNGLAVEAGLMGSADLVQSRTWPGGDLPYIVLGDLAVRGDRDTSGDRTSTLTIGSAGLPAEVRFDSGAGLTIGQDSGQHPGFAGRLLATRVTFKGNTATPSAGFWDGIYFADTSTAGGLTLDACVVEGAGGAGTNGAVAINLTTVVLRNGTVIRLTGNVGLRLSSNDFTVATVTGGEIEGGSGPAVQALGRSTLSLTGVTLRGGSYPVQIQPNVTLSALSGNTASGYPLDRNGIAVEEGLMGSADIVQSRTWPGGDLPYIVLGDLTVRGDRDTSGDRTSTLVIQGPAEVRFNSGTGLTIGRDAGQHPGYAGRLQATGVTFRGNTTSPSAGFWKGIYFTDTTTGGGQTFLDACRVEDAGGYGALGSVVVNATSLELRNGTAVRATSSTGLYLTSSTDSSATALGGEIEGGSGPAVHALGRSTLGLTGVTLRNGSYPVQLQPNVILSALSGNTASGYVAERNGIAVEGGLMGSSSDPQDRTWPGGDLAYIVLADLAIRGNQDTSGNRTSTLTIGAGQPAEVRFNSGAGLTIGQDSGQHPGFAGKLLATGATFKGNTTSPSAGFWDGIYFADTATEGGLILDNCVVEAAGGSSSKGAVAVNATSLVLRNGTVIRHTGNVGLHLSASTATAVTVTGGAIAGGSGSAVQALDRSTLSLTGVALSGGTYPVQIQPNVVLSALLGNTATGYPADRNGVAVEGGLMGSADLVQSRTWPGGDLSYIVLGDLAVRGDRDTSGDRTSTLIIPGPAEVRFNSGAGLTIGRDTGQHPGYAGRLQTTGVTFKGNTTSPSAGFWKGIYFADTTTGGGQTFLDACRVDEAGGHGALGAVVVNATSPELRNGTSVHDTASTGLYLTVSTDSSVTVLGGEIEGGSGPAVYALGRSTLGLKGVMLRKGTYPVQLQPNVILSSLSGNTAFGYVAERSGIAVEGGLMGSSSDPQSRTWPGGDLSYIVLADLAIRGNQDTSGDRTSTLTIGGAGLPAEVRFDAGAGLTIGQDSGQHPGFAGKLLAIGATFKGNTTSPSSGFWDGIYFADTATEGGLILDACVVEGAGGAGSNGAVAVNGTSLVLRNGTAIRATGNVGLWLSASTVTVATATGGEIEGGSGPAVQALGRSTLSLSDVALRGGTYPVRIQPNVILAALGSNTATGYPPTRAGIAVESGLMGNSSGPQSRTWPGGDLSYIVLGGIEIRGDQDTSGDRLSTLVIGAPTEVRFDAGAGLSIGRDLGQHPGYAGQLQATGARFRGNTETTSPGFWKGIYFADTATAGGVLDACAVEDAGGAGSAGAVAVNATSLELRNGTVIRATGNVGLHLSASDFTAATVTGGEIQGGSGPAVQALGRSILSLAGVTLRNGTYPVQIQPNVILTALNGNTAAGYDPARNGIAVESGVMGGTAAQSRTWPGNDLPYIVLGDLSVRGDQSTSGDRTSTLIIGSPTEVRFSSGAGLFIGDDSGIEGGHWGRLQATGVMFTASSATPVPGFWKGIYFGDQALDGAANTFLDACSVEWAGGDVAGAVRINASAPVFKNGVTVRNTATAGVHLSSSTASNASILDGEIEGGADAAMRAAGSSTLLLRDVTLRGGPYPVRIDPNVNVAGLRGSRAEGYPFDRAAVAVESGVMGSSSGSQTRVWPAADLPFLILGNVEVRGTQNTGSDRTSTLVLQGGGEVRFERGTGLQIGDDSGIDGGHWGALRASGVTFTANTLSPVPGFWDGIYFADQMRDDLSFLYDGAVEYGGASGGNVLISRSSPYLSGVVVRGSGQDGVLASNSNSVLTGSHLTGNSSGIRLFYSGSLSLADSDVESNARFGAFNGAPPSLFARFNWWGDPSGPLDPVSNPGGLGDRVAERVDYASWLTASPLPPLAPASVTAQPGDGTVGLAWSANPEKDVTGYKIYRRLPPATAWTLRTSSPVPASASPSFQESGLTNRIGHCYQVRAMDGQGREGDPSREACATPKVDVTPPAWIGPAGALFAEGGDGQGVVRFEPAADASSTAAYDLYYSTVSPVDRSLSGTGRIANVTPVPSSAGHTLEVTVPGLLNGRRYFFNVQAVDSEGNEDGNAAEATAVIGPGSGAVVAASPWTGATLDGVEIDGQGRAVLTSGRTEGQITSAVVELPAGADLSAITWNAVQPAGTAVDTVPGGALTLEVRAADDPAHLADARCIAPSGLAAWWPGDGNGRDVQAGQDGAVRGGTGFAAGRSASAFRFDGIDDRVEIPNFGSFTRFTTQAWVYREGATNTRESLISYKETGCGFVFSLNEDGTSQRPRLWVYVNSVWRFAEGALPIPLERWTHLAGSYDGQEIRVYVDGVLAAATPAVGNMTQCNQRVALGARSSFDQHFFPGRIDEAAIFDRALTVAQIQALSAAGGSSLCKSDADGDGVADLADACPATPARIPVDIAGCPGGCFGPPANRVSWWRGEGNAADSAGTKAGTLVGGTTFDLGKVGQAFRFDGVDDRVEIPNLGSFTQITAQAWVYREGATNTRESLVSYELGCGIVLSLNENGVSQLPRLWVNVNGSWQFAEGTQPFPFGRWTHLAGTYDGQEIRLYVDGALAAVTPAVGNMTQCNEKVALGSRRSFDQYFFPGRLDEVTIFDRALSASEIQALAAAGSAGMCATAPPPSGVPAGTPQVQQGWAQVTPNQPFDLPDGRYVQVRITLRGDGTKSPALRSVSLGYRGGG